MTNQNVQPIFILPENAQRTTGKSAQRNNIMAAKLVAESVRTTLGPKGMDKMLVDSLGDIVVTNDGVTILQEMGIEHPAAKMIVEIAKTQEAEVGDGTTTAVVFAGELLKNAEGLLDQDIHPTVIARGFRLADKKAHEILNDIGLKISAKDNDILKKIAITAMTGKGAEGAIGVMSDVVVKSVKMVILDDSEEIFDIDDIKVEKKVGGGVEDTEIVKGIIIDKEKVHSGMPERVERAKIALIDSPIEIKNTEIDAKIQITDPAQMQAFLDQEEKMLHSMVEKVVASGASVVFCQKGVDDLAQHLLAKKGIYVARRIKKSDMEKLAKATDASLVTNLDDLSSKDLGYAGVVEQRKVGDELMTYVRDCRNPKSVTVLIRGGTEHVIDEVKRAMEDAIGDIRAALSTGKVVGGAGAPEIELGRRLRKYADSLSGREQLAVSAFASAIEIIPKTLAENGGLDPIDIMTELKSAHDKKQLWAGVEVFTGKVIDSWRKGIIEPLKIKTQAVKSATEVATMILRIDDVIASGAGGGGEPPMPSPPGGMGGMPMM